MMGNIDQEIGLLERLDDVVLDGTDDLEGSAGDGTLSDHNAGVEFVLINVLGESAHLLDADGGVGAELDPDGADCGGCGGSVSRGQGGIFGEHSGRGTGGEVHFLAAVEGLDVVSCPQGFTMWERYTQGPRLHQRTSRGTHRGRCGLPLRTAHSPERAF